MRVNPRVFSERQDKLSQGTMQAVVECDLLQWNIKHNTPSELMMAIKDELSPYQLKTLAFDLVWKFTTTYHFKLVVKKAIAEALIHPKEVVL